ncbi:MAG: Asp/Glu racemase [Limnobacter sp.]|jgi:maleate isomerase|uniref:Maleate isomerase n=1 Tax=Limnobacter profundi TaxID=2732163 RepID=A0ABX6NAJ1_9BURK|nr:MULTISPECIES: Asp/Glu racemase [unclassified Limnobacter]MAG81609.1 Asp/Glu racemase [Sutterellaceae bacterium]PZO14909.1 MAG: Asp/Glu racemase [Betaproteobacteria bacterium]KYP10410.1 MAG: Asp/Glu racemase [Limnobacter sp. CACIAM 66H1]MBT85838.1 Asp/Glu racemase [Sutterellaceae bacterium]MDP3270329.1 Asp/Glu racemase [Limnobacter sp.]|tara:strand:+ start:777 stop:1529 length:753 start_codon:yes stop_codon:yes gene_type:complete
MSKIYRIGQIVPSSNTTMETEIPAILRAREAVEAERFTFHSSRMRMQHVTKEELAKMDADSDRCALELADARVDVLGYACLVAIMSMGLGYHKKSEERLHGRTVEAGGPAPVVTSAGALVDGLKAIGAKKVAILTPYMKPLTCLVIDYIENEGIEVLDSISLEVSNNLEVGLLNPLAPIEHTKKLNTANVDAIVASACVQMPSLGSIQPIEDRAGMPVLSSSVATTYMMLKKLGLKTYAPGFGSLLSGKY